MSFIDDTAENKDGGKCPTPPKKSLWVSFSLTNGKSTDTLKTQKDSWMCRNISSNITKLCNTRNRDVKQNGVETPIVNPCRRPEETMTDLVENMVNKLNSSNYDESCNETRENLDTTVSVTNLESLQKMFESPTKRQPSGRKKRSYIETTKTHEKEKRSINGKKREQDERTKASIPLLTISKRCQCQPALCAVKMVKLQVKDSVINTSRFTNLSSSAISDIIVLEYLVDGQKITELEENETISLYFSTKNESVTNGQVKVYCVFLNGTEWSEKGMNVGTVDENEVECRSNHLSSFAMFVLVNNDGGDDGDGDDDDDGDKYHTNSSGKQPISDANKKAIEYISYIGSGLSLVGLFLTSVVYFFLCKDLKILTTTRHLVHFNLQMALGLTQIVFLAGGNATDNEIICKIVAIIMHYFSLAAFSWIFLEVVLLHLKLISVYGGEYVKMKTFYLVGWGFPLVIVGLTAGITAIEDIDYYGRTGEWCWLSYKNGFKWIFFAPIIIISSVTLVAVIAVSRVLFLLSKSEGGNRKNRIITAARGALILFPTLGLSWAFSVVAVNHDALVWKYLFAIFTSLQGFLIFLIYGVCNKEIRTAVVRKIGWDFHPDASTA